MTLDTAEAFIAQRGLAAYEAWCREDDAAFAVEAAMEAAPMRDPEMDEYETPRRRLRVPNRGLVARVAGRLAAKGIFVSTGRAA